MGEASENLEVTKRFYAALTARDAQALLSVLDPELHAEITAGLPQGWGGTYTSARDMLERCWRPIFQQLDIRPVPREYLPSDPDNVVVLGDYQIRSRATGARHDAAFVHVLEFNDRRIRRLAQVTDSARWHQALGTVTPEHPLSTRESHGAARG